MYEAPQITEVGSVRDLTLAQGGRGNDDRFLFFFTYGDKTPNS